MWKSQFSAGRSLANPWQNRGFGVDPTRGPWVPLKANFRTRTWTRWVISHDADIQTPEPEEEEQTRVPGPYADPRGSQNAEPASPAGSSSPGGERRLEVGGMTEARPGAGAPGRFRLPPASRVVRTRDIQGLLRRGRRKKTSHLDVFFLSSEEEGPRVGLIVPKHRRRVVDRNRVKRRLRELSRREVLPRLRDGGVHLDLLIRARREAYETSYRQLRRELLEVTEELCSGRSSWR